MNDDRIWDFERELWTGSADAYDRKVSDKVVMALPAMPYLFDAEAARDAVKDTPRWDEVEFVESCVERPEEGLIAIAYRAKARRGDETYHALCTSTLRRIESGDWEVIQHQQTPLGVEVAEPED